MNEIKPSTRSKGDYIPRLNVEITDEQSQFLRQNLPHGMKRTIFLVLLDSLIKLMKEDKNGTIVKILNMQTTARDLIWDPESWIKNLCLEFEESTQSSSPTYKDFLTFLRRKGLKL